MQDFEEEVEPWHRVGGVVFPGYPCDNNPKRWDREATPIPMYGQCGNDQKYCMSKTKVTFRVEEREHYHLCDDCALYYKGKDFDKLPFSWEQKKLEES